MKISKSKIFISLLLGLRHFFIVRHAFLHGRKFLRLGRLTHFNGYWCFEKRTLSAFPKRREVGVKVKISTAVFVVLVEILFVYGFLNTFLFLENIFFLFHELCDILLIGRLI